MLALDQLHELEQVSIFCQKKEWGCTVDSFSWGSDEDPVTGYLLLFGLPCSLLTLFEEGQLVLLPAPSSEGDGCGMCTRRLPEIPVGDFKHSGSNRQGQLMILRL